MVWATSRDSQARRRAAGWVVERSLRPHRHRHRHRRCAADCGCDDDGDGDCRWMASVSRGAEQKEADDAIGQWQQQQKQQREWRPQRRRKPRKEEPHRQAKEITMRIRGQRLQQERHRE